MKLTEEAREQAKKDLQKRIREAIEVSPAGLTNGEVCHCILAAAIEAKVVT